MVVPMKSLPQVAADFDAIAGELGDAPARQRLTPAERALLSHVPAAAKRAIDVGCGDGVITRALAARGVGVLGIDVSRGMIDLARIRTAPSLPVEYRLLDVMDDSLTIDTFDIVVSVAMVHHLALDVAVARLASLVAPGGVLLLQDVVSRRGPSHLPINAAAWLSRRWRAMVAGSEMPSRVAAAYRAHGTHERYLDVHEVRRVYHRLLPGAEVYHHLEWRYSVVWHRPPSSGLRPSSAFHPA